MKKILLFVAAAFCLCQQACYEDKGHYDYQPSNKVTITMPQEISAYLGEAFTFKPEITFANPDDTAGFEYVWEYKGLGNRLDHYETINEGRTLSFNPSELGTQYVQLCVTDTRARVTTTASMIVRVASRYTRGWLILRNEAGESKLSYIRPDRDENGARVYAPFPDLYGTIYPDARLGSNPWMLRQVMTIEGGIHIMQDEPTRLNGIAYYKEIDLLNDFIGEAPAGFHPVDISCYSSQRSLILDANGSLYFRSRGHFSNIPMQNAGQTLNVKKIYSTRGGSTTYCALHVSDSLLWFQTNSALSSAFLPTVMPSGIVGDYLDFNDLSGVEILYSAFHEETNYVARNITLYSKGGNIYVQQCRTAWPYTPRIDVSELVHLEFPGKAHISASTKYYQLATRSYLFFSDGNELYYYSLVTQGVRPFYTFAPGERVVDMSSNPQESELGVTLESGKFVVLDILNEHLMQGNLLYETDLPGTPVDVEYKYTDYASYVYRAREAYWD